MTTSESPAFDGPARGPRAPTWAEWNAMTPEAQRRAAEALPAWVPPEESGEMEGDRHEAICDSVKSALRLYFEAAGQPVYVSGGVAVYFPGAFKVSPDVFVVREAGNIADSPTNLGSLEYGQAVLGSKLVLVLGHTSCGAVKAAFGDHACQPRPRTS